jgi:hypothetical protein
MTLGMAWLRSLGDIRELGVASDSRLSGGQFWDANPKILLMNYEKFGYSVVDPDNPAPVRKVSGRYSTEGRV